VNRSARGFAIEMYGRVAFAQLPEDVRALEDCPFPVEWQPVVSILQFQTPEIDGLALRDTLLRKEKIRVVQVR